MWHHLATHNSILTFKCHLSLSTHYYLIHWLTVPNPYAVSCTGSVTDATVPFIHISRSFIHSCVSTNDLHTNTLHTRITIISF
eukprot:m.288767 g.288767  ORF g.288767 m.288767 type:complete len:83 (+) comp15805_c0_seq21:423-671(+)